MSNGFQGSFDRMGNHYQYKSQQDMGGRASIAQLQAQAGGSKATDRQPGEKAMTQENDRELLELAAKAAGYQVVWNENWNCFQHRNPVPDKFGSSRHPWVPLEDDGDALRLAVKLEMQLRLRHSENEVSVYGAPDGRIDESVHGNPSAATRRAIVRAAAEIGKQQ